jgi:hypothetical protein
VDLLAKLLQFSELTGNIARFLRLIWAIRLHHFSLNRAARMPDQLDRNVIDADQSDARFPN